MKGSIRRRYARWPLRRRLAAVFITAAVLLIAGLTVSALAANRVFNAQERLTDRVSPAYIAAGDYVTALLDQETGVRGYALTDQRSFLAPYFTGVQNAAAAEARTRSLLRDDARALGLFAEVHARTQTWLDDYAKPTIAALDAGAPRQTDTQLHAGKALMDDVRAASDRYQARLDEIRGDARADLRQATWTLVGILAGGAIPMAVAAFGAWFALRRWVTEPLDRLGSEAAQVTEGDLEHQVVVFGPPEITQLAADVDLMRERLAGQVAALEEQGRELARSNADLEQFAYVASHDLQEPLRKVASFTQLLHKRYHGQLDERADQYIDFAVDGAKRMQQLVNDLLAFSRVVRNQRERVAVDVRSCLDDALHNLGASLDGSGATVDAGPLPVVQGEAALITQLLQNLIGNALKFRSDEKPLITISARPVSGPSGAMWEFACSDNGIGIEPQYAERIFVIFQRLHTRDTYQGTGIGLALCKKIVEYLGGDIWLDTSTGPGATFRWTLPAASRPAEPVEPAERPAAAVAEEAGSLT